MYNFCRNGTILDIRNRNLYHEHEYNVENEKGETFYIICGDNTEFGRKIIYFDDIQQMTSTILTSIRHERGL